METKEPDTAMAILQKEHTTGDSNIYTAGENINCLTPLENSLVLFSVADYASSIGTRHSTPDIYIYIWEYIYSQNFLHIYAGRYEWESPGSFVYNSSKQQIKE